jgi:mannose-6-phosphate isomerase-like protein (cupin superfamily)
MGIRRVVTGHDEQGRAIFVQDGEVDPTTVQLLSASFHEFWRADAPPAIPNEGANGPKSTFFPPPGGYRFFIMTLPPDEDAASSGDLDLQASLRELEEKMPGVAERLEPDDPGMHRTDTVDMEIVISGELTLELDDGAERTLHPGDVIVQNGTRHRWHNRGQEPVVLACVLIGATHT